MEIAIDSEDPSQKHAPAGEGANQSSPTPPQQPTPSNPELEKGHFDVNKLASEYFDRDWGLSDEAEWERREHQEDKKHLRDLLSQYKRNLRSLQQQRSKLGLGDAGHRTLDNEEVDLKEKIKEIETKLFGSIHTAFEESRSLSLEIESQQNLQNTTIEQKDAFAWFVELDDRDKYFLITLSMFNGLKYPDFKKVLELVLNNLKTNASEADKARSPFEEFSPDLSAMIEMIPSSDGLEHRLRFKDNGNAAAIIAFVRDRYPNVLLNFLPVLKQIVESYRYWEIRSRAALATADICKLGFRNVQNLALDSWANDQRAYVRAAVGYPLARLAEDTASRVAVKGLLTNWTDPEWQGTGVTWRYRWTAASTLKQIGFIKEDWAIDWAYQGLKKVAGFDDIRLADAVIHSLVVLSLQGQLATILHTLKDWIVEGSGGTKKNGSPQIRCIVAILAFMALSEIHIEADEFTEEEDADQSKIQVGNLLDLVCQGSAAGDETWQLAAAVGVRAFEFNLARPFFDLIGRWTLQSADNPSVQNIVRKLLVEVFVESRSLARDNIWRRLTNWEKQTKDEHLSEMASSTKVKVKERILD